MESWPDTHADCGLVLSNHNSFSSLDVQVTNMASKNFSTENCITLFPAGLDILLISYPRTIREVTNPSME